MKTFEYKTHYLQFEGKLGDREAFLVQALNEFGRDGWRLQRTYPDFNLRTFTSWGGGLNLLLEREVQSPT